MRETLKTSQRPAGPPWQGTTPLSLSSNRKQHVGFGIGVFTVLDWALEVLNKISLIFLAKPLFLKKMIF
jgi:hypothetical protein